MSHYCPRISINPAYWTAQFQDEESEFKWHKEWGGTWKRYVPNSLMLETADGEINSKLGSDQNPQKRGAVACMLCQAEHTSMCHHRAFSIYVSLLSRHFKWSGSLKAAHWRDQFQDQRETVSVSELLNAGRGWCKCTRPSTGLFISS